MTTAPITLRTLEGAALDGALDGLARLRLTVFREWPYLYAGTADYERWYLERFAAAPDALIVAAFAGDELVGAATGAPLVHEHEAFKAPFEARGWAVHELFYFAESVLLPAWRGLGLGHRFFDLREARARSLGFAFATFCGVVRPDDHPLRPAAYRPLDPFWEKRGYAPVPGLVTGFSWQDLDRRDETEKPMQFWLRRLRAEARSRQPRVRGASAPLRSSELHRAGHAPKTDATGRGTAPARSGEEGR